MRVRAVIAYDGTGYGGFQIQDNAPTVQGELEQALAGLTGEPVRIVAAGRTDAGVHAEGQVVAFQADWRHPLADLQRGMNALLPDQVSVLELSQAEAGFHPRYDARSRQYRYTIYRGEVRHPFHERHSVHISAPLDLGAMAQAAQSLLGSQDFLAFGSPPQGNNSVREVKRAEWSEDELWLVFDVEANAFLYRMVRMLVGTLLRVGRRRLTPEEFEEILKTRDRQRAGPAAEAKGLSLTRVIY